LDLYWTKIGNPGIAPQVIQQIVPWEFFKGQKFDIDRIFGDGTDNNGDFVRDDPFEAINGEYAWQGGPPSMTLAGTQVVMANLPPTYSSLGTTKIYSQATNLVIVNPSVATGSTQTLSYQSDNFYARQLYARHL